MNILQRAKRAGGSGLPATAIAKRANISSAHAFHILQGLELEGLVERCTEAQRGVLWAWS